MIRSRASKCANDRDFASRLLSLVTIMLKTGEQTNRDTVNKVSLFYFREYG